VSLTRRFDAVVAFARGFFQNQTKESMVRLVAFLCGVGGGICVLAAYSLAHRPRVTPEHVAMIGELTKFAAVFIGGGAVALLTRTKGPPPEGPT
jgi:hypothetical protein